MIGFYAVTIGKIHFINREDLADQLASGIINPASSHAVFIFKIPAKPTHPAACAATFAFTLSL